MFADGSVHCAESSGETIGAFESRLNTVSLDIVPERQRRFLLVRSRRKYLADRIRKFERNRASASEIACVEIELRESHDVAKHDPQVGLAATDLDGKRIGNLSPWVGLQTRNPAPRPKRSSGGAP